MKSSNFEGHHHSEETKIKLRNIFLGRKRPPFSEAWRKKLSEANRGKKNRLGQKHTPESRAKMSSVAKGKKKSREHILNMKLAKQNISKETRERISIGQRRRDKNSFKHYIKISEEHRRKISEANRNRFKGEKSPLWKGGLTSQSKRLHNSLEFKIWRKAVFERDNYTCRMCGIKSGNGKSVKLHPHHIWEFAKFPKLRFDLRNGLTVCVECHRKIHWGKKKWEM